MLILRLVAVYAVRAAASRASGETVADAGAAANEAYDGAQDGEEVGRDD